MFTAKKANSKQKRVKKTQNMKKGMLLQGYSPWQVGGEQTLLSVTYSSPWLAGGEQALLSVVKCDF